MQIVIEGPDACGKSTLAKYLSEELGMRVIEGRGPERYPGEIDVRAREWLDIPGEALFDRHPCVSHQVYATFSGAPLMKPSLVSEFYCRRNILLIGCLPSDLPTEHQAKGYDTPEHLSMIGTHKCGINQMYREWALKHAHILYRVGDPMHLTLSLIRGAREYHAY